jgi:carbonic anhydrase
MLKRLLDGYARFRATAFPARKDHFHLLSEGQSPEFLFITCADSRIVPDLIFQTEPGDLFICRNVGNVVPPSGEIPGGVSSTVEYAVEVLGVRHVIICGHSDCGAVKAAIKRATLKGLPTTQQWLGYIEQGWRLRGLGASLADEEPKIEKLIQANVLAQLENLKTHPEVRRGIERGSLEVHGWYYDILSGTIEAYDSESQGFRPLEAFPVEV